MSFLWIRLNTVICQSSPACGELSVRMNKQDACNFHRSLASRMCATSTVKLDLLRVVVEATTFPFSSLSKRKACMDAGTTNRILQERASFSL